jgi:hypothetical protein
VHVFGDLNNNLLSVGQLCDAGCDVKFDTHKATVHAKTEIVLTAKCDHSNGLWRAPLTNNIVTTAHCNHTQTNVMDTKCYLQRYTKNNKSPTACCNNVQDYTNNKYAISYLQGATCSPVKMTLIQAIKKGNFSTWPGITTYNVNKHYEHTIATTKGHMAQTRRNTRSTKPKQKPEKESDAAVTEDFAPTDNVPQWSNEVYTIITELDGKLYTDLTG